MKLYILIQRLLKRQWVRCFVLFFILISIIAVIASSFEEMSEYKVPLFGITYISSFVFTSMSLYIPKYLVILFVPSCSNILRSSGANITINIHFPSMVLLIL